jgi:hypothetical protein
MQNIRASPPLAGRLTPTVETASVAGFRAHRRRGNGERSPVHVKNSPAAATLPRPFLHGKQEDSRIYLASKFAPMVNGRKKPTPRVAEEGGHV